MRELDSAFTVRRGQELCQVTGGRRHAALPLSRVTLCRIAAQRSSGRAPPRLEIDQRKQGSARGARIISAASPTATRCRRANHAREATSHATDRLGPPAQNSLATITERMLNQDHTIKAMTTTMGKPWKVRRCFIVCAPSGFGKW